MKNLLLTLLLAVSLTAIGQDFKKSNKISLFTAPGAYEDGANFGISYEYFNRVIYVGPEIYNFPDLNKITYTHALARIGLNYNFLQQLGTDDNILRVYSGVRLGFIFRDQNTYPLLGFEAGIDFNIPTTNIYTGVSISRDQKGDCKLYSNQDHHMVNAVFVKLGLNF